MKKKFKLILIAFIFIIFIGVIFFSRFSSLDTMVYRNKDKMIESTLRWGRLAPFPKNAENFVITTEGGPFTRSFRAKFNASEGIIRLWVKNSPGFGDAKREVMAAGKEKYIINPGDGAGYAEVVIDYANKHVEIYVSWS